MRTAYEDDKPLNMQVFTAYLPMITRGHVYESNAVKASPSIWYIYISVEFGRNVENGKHYVDSRQAHRVISPRF